jgi:hypothetical protein
MKKLLIIFAVSILGMVACNERVEVVNDNANLDGIKSSSYYTRADLQHLDLTNIRTIFNTVSPQNRYDLFTDKLNFILNLTLTSSQEYLINDILSHLSVDVFNWNSSDYINFTEIYLPSIVSDLENNFTNQEGLNAFYHLYDVPFLDYEPQFIYSDVPPPSDCDCNKTSLFGACQMTAWSCETLTCVSITKGCGFGGFFNCNGRCSDGLIFPWTPGGGLNPQLFSTSYYQSE